VVSSYTPTFAALVTAQQGAKVYTPSQTSILLVPAGRAHDSSMPTLRCVEEEADNVHEIAARAGASTTTAVDLAGVAASLQSASIAHIACHGIQHSREPHKSRFCLSDGNISISELMQLDLRGAFLAFLSACETAKGDWQHPDEAVHLAAAMLFVGFRSVVASMW
jgi:CHAT domain-containing protein